MLTPDGSIVSGCEEFQHHSSDVEAHWRLRSASSSPLVVLRTQLRPIGDRAFPVARPPMLPTFQVAEDFALPVATASSSLRFTAPTVGSRAFSAAGSQVWNCLTLEDTSAPSQPTIWNALSNEPA